jgi:predicted histone-like DNA-binding protein
MSIRYRKVQNKNKKSAAYGKWYGKSVILDTIKTKDLAKEISHSTTVTYADVLAVLAEVSEAMKRHLQNSHKVVLDGLGSFKVGVKSIGADSREQFDGRQIIGYRIVYTPERFFNASGTNEEGKPTGVYVKNLLEGVTAKELALADPTGEGKTPTDAAEGDDHSTVPGA